MVTYFTGWTFLVLGLFLARCVVARKLGQVLVLSPPCLDENVDQACRCSGNALVLHSVGALSESRSGHRLL
jgi:hypothetical protein